MSLEPPTPCDDDRLRMYPSMSSSSSSPAAIAPPSSSRQASSSLLLPVLLDDDDEPRRLAPLPKRQRLQRALPISLPGDQGVDYGNKPFSFGTIDQDKLTSGASAQAQAQLPSSGSLSTTRQEPRDRDQDDDDEEHWEEVESNRMLEQSNLSSKVRPAHEALLEYREADDDDGVDDQGRASNHPATRRPPISSSNPRNDHQTATPTGSGTSSQNDAPSAPREIVDVASSQPPPDDRVEVASSSSNAPSSVATSPTSTTSSHHDHSMGEHLLKSTLIDRAIHVDANADRSSFDSSAPSSSASATIEGSLFGSVGQDVLRALSSSMQGLSISKNKSDLSIGAGGDEIARERPTWHPSSTTGDDHSAPEADDDDSYLLHHHHHDRSYSNSRATKAESPSPNDSQAGDSRMTKKRKNPLGSISTGEDDERDRDDLSTRGSTVGDAGSKMGAGRSETGSFMGRSGLVPANPPTTAKAALAKLRDLPPRLSRIDLTLSRRRQTMIRSHGGDNATPLELPAVPVYSAPALYRQGAPPPLQPGSGLKGSKAIKAAAKAEKERVKEKERINSLLGGSRLRLINLWDPSGLEESAAAIERARKRLVAASVRDQPFVGAPTLVDFEFEESTPVLIKKRLEVLKAARDQIKVVELRAAKAREEERMRRLQKEKVSLLQESEAQKAAATTTTPALAPLPPIPAVVPRPAPISSPSTVTARSSATTTSADKGATLTASPIAAARSSTTPTAAPPTAPRPPSTTTLPSVPTPHSTTIPSSAAPTGPLASNRANLPITSPTTYTTEPPCSIPASTRKPKKGKKKRSAHANALNPHHLNNYTPSRIPASGPGSGPTHDDPHHPPPTLLSILDRQVPEFSSWPASEEVLHEAREALVKIGKTPSEALAFLAGPEEEVCAFCAYDLWWGDEAGLGRVVRKRKGVLKVRKKAKERARKAANGKTTAAATTMPTAAAEASSSTPVVKTYREETMTLNEGQDAGDP